jgi:hypothetical protein
LERPPILAATLAICSRNLGCRSEGHETIEATQVDLHLLQRGVAFAMRPMKRFFSRWWVQLGTAVLIMLWWCTLGVFVMLCSAGGTVDAHTSDATTVVKTCEDGMLSYGYLGTGLILALSLLVAWRQRAARMKPHEANPVT